MYPKLACMKYSDAMIYNREAAKDILSAVLIGTQTDINLRNPLTTWKLRSYLCWPIQYNRICFIQCEMRRVIHC